MAESYPTWVAGEDITADKLNSMLPMFARKTADETVNNTTTVQNDNELLFSVEANAIYALDGWIKYSSSTTADISFDWTVPTGALGEWGGWAVGRNAADSVNGNTIRTDSNDIAGARTFGGTGEGVSLTAIIYGTLRTSSTAGTYQFQWAQAAADATDTVVYSDSWLRLQRIA